MSMTYKDQMNHPAVIAATVKVHEAERAVKEADVTNARDGATARDEPGNVTAARSNARYALRQWKDKQLSAAQAARDAAMYQTIYEDSLAKLAALSTEPHALPVP